ncbi:Alw26I/Eco31I/Esp3I family type II restriction endonuclease [Proteinivorax tanatarense]|uniref:Alw26I/Eco31I/Esp3I family type II restriction endonuclease n=1 Tax=Proteinivorax tanatarense TaxID=1260629 RepID=A0AAU7VKD2_9FIRM
MAKKGAKKYNYDANEKFIEYEEEIAKNPAYEGMPDLRLDDGSIQWEAPSNRGSGKFQFTHNKRLSWWKKKASQVGISTSANHWISTVAKTIHPTGRKPCKVCGNVMDIRYSYLSSNFIKRVRKLDYVDDTFEISDLTHVLDFIVSFYDTYGAQIFDDLPVLFKCKQFPTFSEIPNSIDSWTDWLDKVYIAAEPSMLGPGAMSNAPDRLDGFHSFNRCCRSNADKGRSKENLASYSTDRRAFENWVDGNWITANKLMGYISSNSKIKKEPCANDGDGHTHPRPCSADHIGPISLGFSHRPEFQLLCAPCNSAKNNRMYYSDVKHLIEAESKGEKVVTWYAQSIWKYTKDKVFDTETALRLTRVMRDNRNVAMMLLNEFLVNKHYLFLLTFLNLSYANFDYKLNTAEINNHIVKANFSDTASTLKYVNIQKIRKIRIAFESLAEYANKENRNGYLFTNDSIENLKNSALDNLEDTSRDIQQINNKLISILDYDDMKDIDLEEFLNEIDYELIENYPDFVKVKNTMFKIMDMTAKTLSDNWDDSRYSRE